jgi:2-oxoglutarate ferredoxin oxidoreductase subunit alpha
LTAKAINLAFKYQTPAIILMDKNLSESTFTFNKNILSKAEKEEGFVWDGKKEYKRYEITKTGISPIAFPGGDVIVKATSYEHDEYGISTEDKNIIKEMQEKRLRKFELMKKEAEEMEAVNTFGNSEIAVFCFGSLKGVVKKICEKLKLKMIQPIVLEPFPEKKIKESLKGVKKIVCVESNSLGQLSQLLNQYGIKVDKKILKYDGRPFTEEELEDNLKNI